MSRKFKQKIEALSQIYPNKDEGGPDSDDLRTFNLIAKRSKLVRVRKKSLLIVGDDGQ